MCLFSFIFLRNSTVMVQWSNRRKKDNKRALYKRKRVMCFWRAWNNNWRIRFFSRNNKQEIQFFLAFPHFGAFAFPLIPRLTVFFLSSPSSSLLCLWNSLFLRPFYPFFTLIQYFKVKRLTFSSSDCFLTVLWISYKQKIAFKAHILSLRTSLT